ncbi:uncharacterized protein LOC122243980, partial [Penaeus japonicus]|uniref:uncharacterized protein LOC122243980 n=1 Tax=Penaeus japonicus TaxID=27405 RepID=UPI001C70F168
MRLRVLFAAAFCFPDVSNALILIPTVAGTFTVAGPAVLVKAILSAVGGLAAIQGAAWLGYLAGRISKTRTEEKNKRSLQPDNLILSAVHELDSYDCVKKMLCHIESLDSNSRTQQEGLLLKMFGLPFSKDSEVKGKAKEAVVCDQMYSKCPLDQGLLRGLLNVTWGCLTPFDLGSSLELM